MTDFLSTWLERKPNLALPYVSANSYACVSSASTRGAARPDPSDLKQDAGNSVPRTLWNDMEEVNFLMGKPATLAQAVTPVALSDPALLPVTQKGSVNFTVAKVPDYIAAGLTCSPEASPTPPSRTYGKYYASVFRLRIPGSNDAPILLLWQKESGYWNCCMANRSGRSTGRCRAAASGDLAQKTAVTPEATAAESHPDPGLMQRIEKFFDVLLLERDSDLAFSYFAPSAYSCVSLASRNEVKQANGIQNEAEYLSPGPKEVTRRAPAFRAAGTNYQ